MSSDREKLAALSVEIREKARKQLRDLEALNVDALVKAGDLIPQKQRGWYELPRNIHDLPGIDILAVEFVQLKDGRFKVKLANRDRMLKALRELANPT